MAKKENIRKEGSKLLFVASLWFRALTITSFTELVSAIISSRPEQ